MQKANKLQTVILVIACYLAQCNLVTYGITVTPIVYIEANEDLP